MWFMAVLLLPPALVLIALKFSVGVISDQPQFAGVFYYIRLFLSDKTFWKALLNTAAIPIAVSFVLVLAFAVIVCIVREKIHVPRWVFYLGSAFIGGVTSFVYITYRHAAFFGVLEESWYIQSLGSLADDVLTTAFDAMSLLNAGVALYVGILTAFVVWTLGRIADWVKNLKGKGTRDEQVAVG